MKEFYEEMRKRQRIAIRKKLWDLFILILIAFILWELLG